MTASARIHSSSLVEDGAQIGEDVFIGPFCHIGPNVSLADGVVLKSHIVITGRTSIGSHTRVFPGAVLGEEPQNVNYRGEETDLSIGANCVIREGVTMHTGMPNAGGVTTVGDRSMFLAYSHVAHDCRIGNDVILSNNVMLGGHVEVGDRVIMGGGAAVHQFCRIAHHAFVGGMTGVGRDIIPYGMMTGNPGQLAGLNVVGMQRAGIGKDEIRAVRRAFKQLFYGGKPIREMVAQVRDDYVGNAIAQEIIEFLVSESIRGFATAIRENRIRDDSDATVDQL